MKHDDLCSGLGFHSRFGLAILAVATTAIALYAGCGRSTDVRSNMREVYKDTRTLSAYVWSPSEFSDPANDGRIKELIDDLVKRFHKLDKISPAYKDEPGFVVTLQIHERLLDDARSAFSDGRKDYSAWRLRGLTSNCVSCHSRYRVPNDFIGDTVVPTERSFEARYGAAEFLIASHQFDKASESLFDLALSFARTGSGTAQIEDLLALWLVVEVRVKNRPAEAAERLADLQAAAERSGVLMPVITTWRSELTSLSTMTSLEAAPAGGPVSQSRLVQARNLLAPVLGQDRLEEDSSHLVKTLAATRLLHEILDFSGPSDGSPDAAAQETGKRREALFLLAQGYYHLPIRTFQVFPELYLEQCIRQYPGSKEAQASYQSLKVLFERNSSGSSGVNLTEADKLRLAELHSIAYGENSK